MAETPRPAIPNVGEDFSIVLGGPLYQLWLKTRMVRPPLDLARRRVIALTALAWVPAALLALAEGRFLPGTDGALSFLHDIEAHIKLLVAVPALVIAETVIHKRLLPAVRAFLDRGLVREADVPRFQDAIARALRLRNSVAMEIGLLVLSATAGFVLWREGFALDKSSWYLDVKEEEAATLTAGGAWYAFVSLTIARFLLLRWFFRLFIWGRFLWAVSRLDLRIVPTHPDRCGGLGFIGDATYAFGPVLFAQGATLAAVVASEVFHKGTDPFEFKVHLACLIAILTFVVALPCFFFCVPMAQAKRRGKGAYGLLSSNYVNSFEDKWVPRAGEAAPSGNPGGEPLLGSADLQSLADLGNATAVVREMRTTPLDLKDLVRLAIPVAIPVLPLALTKVPIEEVLEKLIQVIL